MNKTLTHSFLDILTPRERRFYAEYRLGQDLSPHEKAIFEAIAVKKARFKKEKKWINRLAWSVVRDVEPQRVTSAKFTLYEAYVWAQTL